MSKTKDLTIPQMMTTLFEERLTKSKTGFTRANRGLYVEVWGRPYVKFTEEQVFVGLIENTQGFNNSKSYDFVSWLYEYAEPGFDPDELVAKVYKVVRGFFLLANQAGERNPGCGPHGFSPSSTKDLPD